MKKFGLFIVFMLLLAVSINAKEIVKVKERVITYSGSEQTFTYTFGGTTNNDLGYVRTSGISSWSVWVGDSVDASGYLTVQYEEINKDGKVGSDGADKKTLWSSQALSDDWVDHEALESIDLCEGIKFYITWTGGDSGDKIWFQLHFIESE